LKNILEKYLKKIQKTKESIFPMDSPATGKKFFRMPYPNEQDTELEDNKKSICIDFDKTIHKYSKGWDDGSIYDEPIPGIKNFIDSLKNKYKIVIFSTRVAPSNNSDFKEQKNAMIKWLNKYKIHFDEITSEKIPAIAYVDDRGINFSGSNFDYVLKMINKLEREEM